MAKKKKRGGRPKTKAGVNKSQAIRDYIAKGPAAGPKAIREALAAKRIEASDGLISQVKYKQPSPTTTNGRKKKKRAGSASFASHFSLFTSHFFGRSIYSWTGS